MAIYKVPQDVEAEDKLIGPFGFRQFIYLIIVAFACFVAFLLAKISIVLIAIPLPFIVFFTAIALPLRKDQPTEVYLAALLQFYLKPKKRMWMPDGVLSTVDIIAPKIVEERRTKDLTQDEALERLNSLAQIMDTRGWAARGVFNPDVNSTAPTQLSDQALADAAEPDILDDSGISAQAFDHLIDVQKAQQRQAVQERMRVAQEQAPSTGEAVVDLPVQPATIQANPYPSSIHQQVVQPLDPQHVIAVPSQTPQSTSDPTTATAIIDLVESPFSVATIAGELHRKEDSQANEVEIKLH